MRMQFRFFAWADLVFKSSQAHTNLIKPCRHKWNQLNDVTDALLDVALNVSSTFMLQMPLIEEGVQHVHPIDRNLRSFLRSCSHVVFLAQQPRINSLYVGGHPCLSSPSQQL